MGIINLTPDSFFPDSRCSVQDAAARIARMLDDGADIIDIGAVSTRPGAGDVGTEEEWRRLSPVLPMLEGVRFSVDTTSAEIVRRVFREAGPFIVNDISAGEADAGMIPAVAELGLTYIMIHMRGTPSTMQSQTGYADVVSEVKEYLLARAEYAVSAGVKRESLVLDPGFGFAKTVEQNYELMRRLHEICGTGYPVLAGISRKSMIYRLLGITPEESLIGTAALNWEALRQGASVLRVHDVREAAWVVRMFEAFRNGCTDGAEG